MTIQAQCKFCLVPITATADDECPELNLKAWLSLLCCNRCGSFRAWFERILHSTRDLCRGWAILSPRQRESARPELDQNLERITRRIADQTCRYYRVGHTWERDFVDQLLERPDKAEFIIRQYEDIVRRAAMAMRNRQQVLTYENDEHPEEVRSGD